MIRFSIKCHKNVKKTQKNKNNMRMSVARNPVLHAYSGFNVETDKNNSPPKIKIYNNNK